jgi:hypothetical protein
MYWVTSLNWHFCKSVTYNKLCCFCFSLKWFITLSIKLQVSEDTVVKLQKIDDNYPWEQGNSQKFSRMAAKQKISTAKGEIGST